MKNKVLQSFRTTIIFLFFLLLFSCQPESMPVAAGVDMTYSHKDPPGLSLQAYYLTDEPLPFTTRFELKELPVIFNADEKALEPGVMEPVVHHVLQMETEIRAPLLDSLFFNKLALQCFFGLGSGTDGRFYYHMGSDTVYRTIARVIRENAVPGADVVLLIDKTASMQDDIIDVKNNLGFIIRQLHKIDDVRLAVGVYGDMNMDGLDWWDCTPLSHDFKPAMNFINKIKVSGGGDFPESVYDGLDRTLDYLDFRPGSKRMILVVGDAPSLDPPASAVSREQILDRLNSKEVKANIYPVLISLQNIHTSVLPVVTGDKGRFSLRVYPNPASEHVEVSCSKHASYSLCLVTSTGLVVTTKRFEGEEYHLLLGEDLSPGTYFLRITDMKTRISETQKVVIGK